MKNELHHKELLEIITTVENIEDAFKLAMKGNNRSKLQAIDFERHKFHNLTLLKNQLVDGTYEVGKYNKFKTYYPKERLIYSPHFRDKVVQHAINTILRPIYERKFIYDSYACLTNKGNHAAVRRLKYFTQEAYKAWGCNAYVVKIDIKKFFYTINRKVLCDILDSDITNCPELLVILYKIILSSPEDGLPLGNLSSQLFANILMNEVDQYAKNTLKLKYYLRYADDIFIIVEDKVIAKNILSHLKTFIKSATDLECHPSKSSVYPLRRGINGLGFITYYNRISITQENKRSLRNLIKDIHRDKINGSIDRILRESQLNSYKSFMSISGTQYMESLLNSDPYIDFNNGKVKLKN